MEFIYNIFVFPLEFLMEIILKSAFSLSGNYIFSLLAVSVAVNIGVLPLYHIAEIWQDKERLIQQKLRPKIHEFKSVFSGQQLNAYIKTLYRQNNYHPIFAVRTSFGLLIQIPFFFAAYHLLSNFSEFEGISVLVFSDLGKADGLLKIGGYSINIMPFIMTFINLVSATVYSKKTILKEKIQLYGMALLFLIILYNSPSGLLFYWTCNNFLSLIKNIIYSRIYGNLKITEVSDTESISKEFKLFSFFKKFKKAEPSFWNKFILILFFISLYGISYKITESSSWAQFWSLALSFIILFILVFFDFIKIFEFKSSFLKAFFLLIYFFVLITGFFAYFAASAGLGNELLIKKTVILSYALLLMVNIIIKLLIFLSEKTNLSENSRSENKLLGRIYLLAVVFLFFLIFFTVPSSFVLSGSASDFDSSLLSLLKPSIPYFFALIFISFAFYRAIPVGFRKILAMGVVILSLYATVNIFIFTGEYGNMGYFEFLNELKIEPLSVFGSFIVLILIILLTFIFMTIKKKGCEIVLSLFYILMLTSFSMTLINFYRHDSRLSEKSHEKNRIEKEFVFTKQGRNVVIVMLDRFIGGFIPELFKEIPELKRTFTGFVYYPQSLSNSGATVSGVPAIMGGCDYDITTVLNERKEISLKKKLDEAVRILPYNFTNAGYDSAMFSVPSDWYDQNNTEYLSNVRIEPIIGKYKNLWMDKHAKYSIDKDYTPVYFIMFSFFRAAPPALRKWIYDDGDWHLNQNKTDDENEETINRSEKNKNRINAALKSWSTLELLPEISETSENPKNKFYYMTNEFTHEPWISDGNFAPNLDYKTSYPRKMYEKFNKDINSVIHFCTDGAALKSLSKWINWMKKNGVYDNTRIIFVSDHGRELYDPAFKIQSLPGSKFKLKGALFNNLFMIKDFNSEGNLKTASQFVRTCDVPEFALKDIIEGINPYTGKSLKSSLRLPFRAYRIPWRLAEQKEFEYSYDAVYQINSQDIFDYKNWTIIYEKK